MNQAQLAAKTVRDLAQSVVRLVALEEKHLTKRDAMEDAGRPQDVVDFWQSQVDDAVNTYRQLLEGPLVEFGVTSGLSEDDDIQTCRVVADLSVYAIVSKYPKVRG